MEQYLLLAKRAKGRALVDLIQKATAEPGTFAFAELLDLPNVKDVRPIPWLHILLALGMSCWTVICRLSTDCLCSPGCLPVLKD